MSNEIKYIQLVTWNKEMMLMYGDKLTGTQKAIGRRSNGLHTCIRHSDRYRHIWFSCTCADGADGCRFKMINRSHPYRQSVVNIPVTADQEARLFAKECEMADMHCIDYALGDWVGLLNDKQVAYGPNHIKYDKWGARFAFILKWELWKMDRVKMICSEACANVLLEVWPDMLTVKNQKLDWGQIILDPATITPEQFEYQVRHYFELLRKA